MGNTVEVKTVNLTSLRKDGLIKVARKIGMKGDFEGDWTLAKIVEGIQRVYLDRPQDVKDALYGTAELNLSQTDVDHRCGVAAVTMVRTSRASDSAELTEGLGEGKTDQREGDKLDPPADLKNKDKGGAPSDSDDGENSDGDGEGEGEGEGEESEGNESESEKLPAMIAAAASASGATLAHAIRASETAAHAEAMMSGISGISKVHGPLVAAIQQAFEGLAGSVLENIAAEVAQPSGPDADTLARIDDLAQTIRTITNTVANLAENISRIVTIRTVDAAGNVTSETPVQGLQHKMFGELLSLMNTRRKHDGSRLNVWICGPAGSGKTQAAFNAAQALGLRFYSTGSLTAKHEALGYRDANSNYVQTAFYDAWVNGGVFLFDEFDGSIPNAAVGLNQAFSTPVFTFPDAKTQPRHPDCVILCACNTFGNGGAEYVGRFVQDKATLSRFVFLDWEYDETLELALATRDYGAQGRAWALRVQQARKAAAKNGLKVCITPRATIDGCAMLEQGFKLSRVDAMTIKGGMTRDQFGALGLPAALNV